MADSLRTNDIAAANGEDHVVLQITISGTSRAVTETWMRLRNTVFIAPDGTVHTSRDDYLDYIRQNDAGKR